MNICGTMRLPMRGGLKALKKGFQKNFKGLKNCKSLKRRLKKGGLGHCGKLPCFSSVPEVAEAELPPIQTQ